MEIYIMTFEDGTHYVGKEITQYDRNAVEDGILTIIRCSDQMELTREGNWEPLPEWDSPKGE